MGFFRFSTREATLSTTTWQIRIEITRTEGGSRWMQRARGTWVPGRRPLLLGSDVPAQALEPLDSIDLQGEGSEHRYTMECGGLRYSVHCRR